MTDRLDDMALLVMSVEAGSFSAAAKRLGMPLATVSRRVAELEERLGVRILSRSTRGLSLTEPGQAYLSACRQILDQVSDAERVVRGEFSEPKGKLVLSAPIVFGRLHVVPVIAEFLRTYPEVDVRLVQADRAVSLVEEHIDAAIRIGRLPDSNLRARRVGEVCEVICASPAYLKARREPRRPQDLAGHDCITFEHLMSAERWSFGKGKAHFQQPVHSRMTVNTAEAAVDAAIAGLGITRVLSYQVAGAVMAGKLKVILKKYEPEPLPVNILYGGGLVPGKVRAFVDFAATRLESARLM